MNSPIKYFGGKGTMFNKIIEQFPTDEKINIYIEPFGGSYSIGIKQNRFPVEIYNDLEQNVYSLYKVISEPQLFEEFRRRCELALYSEDIRREYKWLLKRKNLPLIERAFYFFYVNRTSHNGVGGLSANTIVRRGMSKSTSDFLSAIERLPELHDRFSKVLVLNQDGIELIKKYDRDNVFFYLDPPYEQSTRTATRYIVDMDREIQEKLLDTLLNLKNGKFLLSGYDCELYSVLEENGINKIQFEIKTGGGNRNPKTKTETLWRNY